MRAVRVGIAIVFWGVVLLLTGPRTTAAQSATSAPTSASQENPEPGLSGGDIPVPASLSPTAGPIGIMGAPIYPTPYSHGVRVIGHSPMGGIQLGWIDHCAYVANGGGIGVIDASDPMHPRDIGKLTGRGAMQAGENFDARETSSGRRIIVVGASFSAGPGAPPTEPPAYYDIFDAADCEHPVHVAEYVWPENLHTSHISPDGMRIYGTRIEPFAGKGGIHVIDISDMAHPRYIGKFEVTAPDGKTWEFSPHNLMFSPDERTMYVGVVGSEGSDFDNHFTSPVGQYSPERIARDAGGIYIFDNSDLALGRPNPKMRLIGRADHAGWHDVTMAHINGVPYLVAAGEMGACPGTWPRITNISDLKHPRVVGQFRLDMNHEENCPKAAPPQATTQGGNGGDSRMAAMRAMMASMSHAWSHYSSVDISTDTHIGLFQMTNAGLRIADLHDPANPVEVAYFRPGGLCSGFTHYDPKTGNIWMTCGPAGFYILQLTPEVRKSVGLPDAGASSGVSK